MAISGQPKETPIARGCKSLIYKDFIVVARAYLKGLHGLFC